MRSAIDWLLSEGYMVALPLRRGYGDTGGPWAENYGPCRDPDFYRAGLATADDIGAVLQFFGRRSDVKRETMLVIGQSAGGWGSVATASRNPSGVLAILNFAPATRRSASSRPMARRAASTAAPGNASRPGRECRPTNA